MKTLIVLFITICPLFSLGCFCIGENTLQAEFNHSDAVFLGKVISEKTFIINDPNLPRGHILKKIEYLFQIKKLFKGEFNIDTVRFISGIGRGGDCGFRFKVGMEYIVYSTYSDRLFGSGRVVEKFLTTNKCSRTKLINHIEIKEIEKLVKSITNARLTKDDNHIKIPELVTSNPFLDSNSRPFGFTIKYEVDSMEIQVFDSLGMQVSSLLMYSVSSGFVNLNQAISKYKHVARIEARVTIMVFYWVDGKKRFKGGVSKLSWSNPQLQE